MRQALEAPLFAALLGILLLGDSATAAPIRVSSTGTDGPGCGAVSDPCRSIQQAIANAPVGERILVGPGRYGDLDRSGTLGDSPGEEVPSARCESSVPGTFPNLCMVDVSKAVTLESTHGASVTVLDAGGDAANVVWILADGVGFGKRGKGFTARGAVTTGVRVERPLVPPVGLDIDGPFDVQVRGNRAIGNVVGFSIRGGDLEIRDNVALDNDTGFSIGFFDELGRVVVRDNQATGNTNNGFSGTFRSRADDVRGNLAESNGNGFSVSGIQFRFRDNVARGNIGEGMRVTCDTTCTIERNVAEHNGGLGSWFFVSNSIVQKNLSGGNSGPGFDVRLVDSTFLNNHASGNEGYGILVSVFRETRFELNTAAGNGASGMRFEGINRSSTAVISKNNMYGNDDAGSNCGLENASNRTTNGEPSQDSNDLAAPDNYFGAPIGPSANPGDEICDTALGTTTATPFATKPFGLPIKAK